MKFLLKIFQYVYLIFAALFIFNAVSNWSENRDKAYLSLGLAVVALFVFFFRRRFGKKFKNNTN